VRKTRLGEFWASFWRNYGYATVLDQAQIEWIIRAKEEGKLTNEAIARAQTISVSRVQQLYRGWKKTGTIPTLKKAGRPGLPDITEQERALVKQAFDRFRMCACYLEPVIFFHYGVRINHKRIHKVLREEGLALSEPRKWKRKKWIRYERDHSNSLWHTDWHKIKDQRWKDQWLIAYEDDSSRLIAGHGVYPTLTSPFSVEVLDRAVKSYGKPKSILSDHGSTFCGVEAKERDHGLTEFENYLLKNKIRFIMGRAYHPQTNGKIEKFFDIFEKKVKYFHTIDEFMTWYNEVRPHGAFDLTRAQTPLEMFHKRKADPEYLTDPEVLTRGWNDLGIKQCRVRVISPWIH
jgi:putative transposase